MKGLKDFLNESLVTEVSMDLALRAHAKAKGAQQTRIGKLIKQKVDRMIQAAAEAGADVSKPSTKYTYKPESKWVLRELVDRLIEERGNNADLNDIDTSLITDMSYFFAYNKFNGDISKWDVSNVTEMSGMFNDSQFNGDISKWDVSNVKDMSKMFLNNRKFNHDLSNWDVSNVKDMYDMFTSSPLEGKEPEWYRE